MNEQLAIISAFESLCDHGKPAALATVISVSGSAYRRPGARMLIAEDARTWGGVSGGCLERDVIRRSRGVLASGRSITCRYETTDDEDLATGVATGCRGTVDLFIEPLSRESPGPIPWLIQASRERRAVTLATIVRTSAASDAVFPGARVSLDEALPADARLADPTLLRTCLGALSRPPARSGEADFVGSASRTMFPAADKLVRGADPTPIAHRQSATLVQCDAAGATIDVFIERLSPPQELVIFGGGPDVVPVVSIAKLIGWHVSVVGVRPATGLPQRFLEADVLHVTPPDDPVARVEITRESAVVLMTHNYPRDLKILAALPVMPRYLGILGPRIRTQQLLLELGDDHPAWDNLYAPVGLDLGAETSQEIALSIVAEIQAALRSTSAGFLRDRRGPIHLHPDSAPAPADAYRSQRTWREVVCPT